MDNDARKHYADGYAVRVFVNDKTHTSDEIYLWYAAEVTLNGSIVGFDDGHLSEAEAFAWAEERYNLKEDSD